MSDTNRSLGRLCATRDVLDPSEQLLSALLLQVFYRHPLGTPVDGAIGIQSFVPLVRGAFAGQLVSDPATFTKNRERCQNGDVFTKFMTRLLNHARVEPRCRMSVSVDGTLSAKPLGFGGRFSSPRTAAATMSDGANFHGRGAENDTSTPVPADYRTARLYRKAAGRRPGFAIWATPAWRTGRGARGGRQGHACQWPPRTPGLEIMLRARRKAAGRRITTGEDKA